MESKANGIRQRWNLQNIIKRGTNPTSNLKFMKLKLTPLFLLITLLSLNVMANEYRQDITIKKTNVSLESIFREIERQSTFRFFFNETLMQMAELASVNVEKASLEEALNACFNTQPKLTYAIVENTIIVKRREMAAPEKVNAVGIPGRLAEVRGLVSGEDGPVPGATVTVKGTDKVTTTNNSGEFLLYDVDERAVLIVSSVSHEGQEIKLNGKGLINILLDLRVGELDEQIVVAYNRSTKKNNVAALTIIRGDEVRNLPFRSIDKSLQGLVPGLAVTGGTGQPGGGLSNFVLRGIATGAHPIAGMTARNPLIVVDGIPVTQDHTQWIASTTDAPVINPMAQLNPSDIETITVLKDAAAIALYGAKASNGVILITTKQGKAGKTTFNFRHQTDIASRLEGKIELLNQEEYLDLLFETYKNTDAALWTDEKILADLKAKFPTRANGSFYPVTNWTDETYTNHATTISNEFSISGGNEKSKYYANFEHTKQNGIYRGTDYDRKSIRLNFENKPAEWLKFGLNTALSYNVQNYASLEGGTFPLGIATYFPPLHPARREDGTLILNYTFPYQVANPIAAIEYNMKRNIGYRGISKLYGEVSFLKYFKIASAVGIDFMLMESKEKIDPRLFDYVTKSFGGRIQERDARNANLIATNTLRFDKQIKTDHSINVLLGQEAQILTNKYLQAESRNLRTSDFDQIDNGSGTRLANGNATKETLLSYFGQVNYGFKSKYFFSGSLRKDGSSRFGERSRYGTYWSAGAGWVISSESFLKGAEGWLNYLKIRGSIGAAGNASAINRFTRYDQLLISSFQNNTAALPYSAGNPDIRWEETFTWDAGLEARLWNNRIAITADIYKRKTSDLIYTVILPPVTGYSNLPDNIGDMENKGVELSLSVDIVKNKDVRWNINANWSSNKNILVKANVPLEVIGGDIIANEEGKNFNSFYLAEWAGADPVTGAPTWIDTTGKANTDYNAAKKSFVGKPQPDGFGAITNTVSYRNIEFSAMLYYQYGFQIYNTYSLSSNDGFQPYQNSDRRVLDHWRKPGDISNNPKRVLNNTNGVFRTSTRHLFDGDYIRLQTVTIGYKFPKRITDPLRLSLLRLYVQGHNLAIWNKFPGADPSDANIQGAVNISYPNQRTFSIGLNVTF